MVTEAGGRRRHSAAERRAVLRRFAGSNASVGGFCGAESISVATLRRWQAEHGDDAQGEAAPAGFLDMGAVRVGGALTIEVDLGGGMLLRVRRG